MELTESYIAENFVRVKKFVKAFHQAGFVHGDLHRRNIRIDGDGNPKMIDLDTVIESHELYMPMMNEWISLGFNITDNDFFVEYEDIRPFA